MIGAASGSLSPRAGWGGLRRERKQASALQKRGELWPFWSAVLGTALDGPLVVSEAMRGLSDRTGWTEAFPEAFADVDEESPYC